jgi:hypothetical protein
MTRIEKLVLDGNVQGIKALLFLDCIMMLIVGFVLGLMFGVSFS